MASYDEDSQRLPEGFRRIGYDADNQITYYQDRRGSSWQSPPGDEYGQLTRVPVEPQVQIGTGESRMLLGRRMNSIRASRQQWRSRRNSFAQPRQTQDWRYFAPFALLILLFMGLLIWYVRSPPGSLWPGHKGHVAPVPLSCSADTRVYMVRKGDTCWAIAQAASSKVGQLVDMNPGLDCDNLQPGQQICVPRS